MTLEKCNEIILRLWRYEIERIPLNQIANLI